VTAYQQPLTTDSTNCRWYGFLSPKLFPCILTDFAMKEMKFKDLPLSEKANLVREKGQFISAQDFYSYFVLIYELKKHQVNLFYDFTGLLVSVEPDEPIVEEISL
jgi:hypothetical protein